MGVPPPGPVASSAAITLDTLLVPGAISTSIAVSASGTWQQPSKQSSGISLRTERVEQESEAHLLFHRFECGPECRFQRSPLLELEACWLIIHAARLVDHQQHVGGTEACFDRGHAALVETFETVAARDFGAFYLASGAASSVAVAHVAAVAHVEVHGGSCPPRASDRVQPRARNHRCPCMRRSGRAGASKTRSKKHDSLHSWGCSSKEAFRRTTSSSTARSFDPRS